MLSIYQMLSVDLILSICFSKLWTYKILFLYSEYYEIIYIINKWKVTHMSGAFHV